MLRPKFLSALFFSIIALHPSGALATTTDENSPPQSDAHAEERAQILADRANIAYESGEYTKAVELYTELSRVKPKDARVLHNRANSYSKLSELNRAVGDYTSALQLSPTMVAALVNRADVYSRLGDLEKALADYESAERLSPRDGFITYRKAVLLTRLDRRIAAAEAFDQIIGAAPRYAPAHAERGFLYLIEGMSKEAKGEFGAALQYQPGNARAEDGLRRLGAISDDASSNAREEVHNQLIVELLAGIDRTCFTNGENAEALLAAMRKTSWREAPPQVGGAVRIWTGSTAFGSGRLALVRTGDGTSSVCSFSVDGLTPHLFEEFNARFRDRYGIASAAKTDGGTPAFNNYQIAHRADCRVSIFLQSPTYTDRLIVRLKHEIIPRNEKTF